MDWQHYVCIISVCLNSYWYSGCDGMVISLKIIMIFSLYEHKLQVIGQHVMFMCLCFILYAILHYCPAVTVYRIMGIVCGKKVCEFCKSGSMHSWIFSCTFYLGGNFYIWDCLNHENLLVNYGKEGNSWNFSFADDSHCTVPYVHSYRWGFLY